MAANQNVDPASAGLLKILGSDECTADLVFRLLPADQQQGLTSPGLLKQDEALRGGEVGRMPAQGDPGRCPLPSWVCALTPGSSDLAQVT